MTDTWHVIGLRGTGSDTYSVADLFVAEDYTINRDPSNGPREQGPLYRFSSSNVYAAAFAGVALGVARSVLDSFIELARDKIPRGARVTMRNNNVIQSQVAQSEARLASARRYVLGVLDDSWDLIERGFTLSWSRNATLAPWRRPGQSTRPATWWMCCTKRQARPRSSTKTRSSGAFATSTRSPRQMQARQTHFENRRPHHDGPAPGRDDVYVLGQGLARQKVDLERGRGHGRWQMPDVPQYDLITLGETLLRLSPPGMQRLDQARLFETGIGGSELNVGCVLARLGRRVAWVSRLARRAARPPSSTARRAATASTPAGSSGSMMPGSG